jgi:hypothetical protein
MIMNGDSVFRRMQLHLILNLSGSTILFLKLGRHFTFLILYTIGRTLWTGDQPVARPLPAHRTTQTQNKRTQTSMPRVGFEPTIPMLELSKTVPTSDCAVTVIGCHYKYCGCNEANHETRQPE